MTWSDPEELPCGTVHATTTWREPSQNIASDFLGYLLLGLTGPCSSALQYTLYFKEPQQAGLGDNAHHSTLLHHQ